MTAGGECEAVGHEWGPVELAWMTGNPHRKCQRDGCRWVTLDLDDGDEGEGDEGAGEAEPSDDDDGATGGSSTRPTYRERRAARADRLREWADKREAKADAASQRASDMASVIPFGQPILVGHYSEGWDRRYRDRIHSTMGAAVEHGRKAESMRSRADNIDAAADRAIYSDDPDAIERLREKVADLEGQRERWKAYNAACRKAGRCTEEALALLDATQRREMTTTAERCPEFLGKAGQAPAYHVQNLTGLIGRTRKRLEALERRKA
jgi:Domain of unknown function (DUF3560)/Family of unknown function (DUF6381)